MTKKIISAAKYNINKSLISTDALYVIEKLQKHGYDGYIVGGGIRDLLLGKEPKDFDIVTNATPEMIRKVFKKNSLIIGRRFKLVHIIFENINPEKIINNRPIISRDIIEVSTYRSDKIHHHTLSEHGRIMLDNNYGTQKEDSARRDFTINSLYYDPIAEVIIDYHNGLKDIKNRQISTIGEPRTRYIEDPVRILRAIRLSKKLNLEIHPDTAAPINEVKHLLANETRGRMYEEMLKILLSGTAIDCVYSLIKLKLPHNVFNLFDILFFKPEQPDELALKVLAKTDLRIQENGDVSVIFILTGLLWNIIYKEWQQGLLHTSPRQALLESISKYRHLAYQIGITKNSYANIRDICLLQIELEYPNIKKIDYLLKSPRFRQAWHLFTARFEVGQIDKQLFNWWERYIDTEALDRPNLIEELKILFNIKPLIIFSYFLLYVFISIKYINLSLSIDSNILVF